MKQNNDISVVPNFIKLRQRIEILEQMDDGLSIKELDLFYSKIMERVNSESKVILVGNKNQITNKYLRNKK